MKVRRVVMGNDAQGKTTVIEDGVVEPTTASLLPGVEIHRVWELDSVSVPVTDAATGDKKATFFPANPGVRFGFLTVPPGITYVPEPGADLEAAAAEMEEKLPGAAATFAFPDQPGAHATQTVDYIIVLSGEATMRVDDIEVHLKQGDCLIQNGNPHAWFNNGTEPLVMGFALCGATT
ncbi:Cupin domain-containing protein [Amycolatopsis marina]|uniref:Cupin domain-containing protein n=1 Tax=Amycolatopsis marina TaxID=490629 RepID=A0A1I0YIV8_9PSEU|nr:cupin domain-containing protein [Amycolatopsis marina]SFB13092.1 Cupin domain-containing protein [Amycolatopsis marina]